MYMDVLYVFIAFLSGVRTSIWLFSGLPGVYCYYHGVILVLILIMCGGERFIKASKVTSKPLKPFIYALVSVPKQQYLKHM